MINNYQKGNKLYLEIVEEIVNFEEYKLEIDFHTFIYDTNDSSKLSGAIFTLYDAEDRVVSTVKKEVTIISGGETMLRIFLLMHHGHKIYQKILMVYY